MKGAPRRGSRHPLHPIFTHLPIALLGLAPLWDLTGLLRPEPLWWQLSFWCMAVGDAAALMAIFTGFVDYVAIPEDHPAQRVATHHLVCILAAVLTFAVDLLIRGGAHPPATPYRLPFLLLSGLGLVLLMFGGWYGGELVYGHGIGQRRSPAKEADRPSK